MLTSAKHPAHQARTALRLRMIRSRRVSMLISVRLFILTSVSIPLLLASTAHYNAPSCGKSTFQTEFIQ